MPDNLHKKLNRFQNHIIKSEKPKRDLPERYLRLANFLKGKIVSNYAGSYCLVKTLYPFEYCHGNMMLRNIIDNHSLPLSTFTVKNETENLELSSMLFVDIETTGLGGAGVVPFLIGCGILTDYGFEIHQYLLPDYSDECSMLEDLLNQLSSDKTIVSYNGAAFDLPIIQDRMIINRVASEFNYKHHIDLLHS
ncbi:MAG: ribonuclease H-like domain-containing protein, partial [Candidatus Zixiibacteriota bacterium]